MEKEEASLLCPSAQPEMDNAIVLGVFENAGDDRKLSYLNTVVPVNKEITDTSGGVPPTLVYRFAAKCLSEKCVQYRNGKCKLGKEITGSLRTSTDKLPACTIRSNCRWHHENGAEACFRCSQVITRVEFDNAKVTDRETG
jgi:hypothetical protein